MAQDKVWLFARIFYSHKPPGDGNEVGCRASFCQHRTPRSYQIICYPCPGSVRAGPSPDGWGGFWGPQPRWMGWFLGASAKMDAVVLGASGQMDGVVLGASGQMDGVVLGAPAKMDAVVLGASGQMDGVFLGAPAQMDGVFLGASAQMDGVVLGARRLAGECRQSRGSSGAQRWDLSSRLIDPAVPPLPSSPLPGLSPSRICQAEIL
ncbi:unnamed protein product [Boreogadus saida]